MDWMVNNHIKKHLSNLGMNRSDQPMANTKISTHTKKKKINKQIHTDNKTAPSGCGKP